MLKYTIGEIIRRERKKQKLSQEALSDGICTPSWLSKIESGTCIPTPALFEMLMQRLGKKHTHYIAYLSETEMRIEHLKIDIRRHYDLSDMVKASELFLELEAIAREDHPSDKRFLVIYRYLLFEKEHLSPEERLAILYGALQLTHEAFNLSRMEEYLLTQDEVLVINSIATILDDTEQTTQAIDLWQALRRYLENPRFDDEEKYRAYPTVMYNLGKRQKETDDFIGCLSTCEAAIDFCIKNDSLCILPEIIYYKGCALKRLGVESAAIECFREAYHLFCTTKNLAYADIVKDFFEAHYKLPI